jgi:hypothetical protein
LFTDCSPPQGGSARFRGSGDTKRSYDGRVAISIRNLSDRSFCGSQASTAMASTIVRTESMIVSEPAEHFSPRAIQCPGPSRQLCAGTGGDCGRPLHALLEPFAHHSFTSAAYSSAASSRKVAGVEQIWFAVRQSFVKILGVDGRGRPCLCGPQRSAQASRCASGHLGVLQAPSGRTAPKGPILRIDCPRTKPGVLASGVAEHIALERLHRALDELLSFEPSIRFQVRTDWATARPTLADRFPRNESTRRR